MKHSLQFFKLVIAAAIVAATSVALANQADLNAEKAMYIKAFTSGNLDVIKGKARNLEWTGWSDPAIFDPLEKKIIENLGASDKYSLDSVAWMIRALGSSGNPKYLPTLNRVFNEGSCQKCH